MYNIEELNVSLLSELKDIAEKLGIKEFKKLPKQELIYKILDKQAVTAEEDLPKNKESKSETAAAPKVSVETTVESADPKSETAEDLCNHLI